MKSSHHLLQDRASKGYASIPGLTSQTSLHACLQRINTMQTRNRPMPLTNSVVQQMMARFRNFSSLRKSQDLVKKAQCVSNRCKDLFQQKQYFEFRCTLNSKTASQKSIENAVAVVTSERPWAKLKHQQRDTLLIKLTVATRHNIYMYP